MRSRSLLLGSLTAVTVVATTAVALAGTSAGADPVVEPASAKTTVVAPTDEVAEPSEGPGTGTPPARDDAEYEGPGTDVPPQRVARYDCRELDGTEVCDTFDEVDEGPGTTR
ncbi:hypothetical protein [Egicoccus sp. AB-alg2]|uniref:hypothetical protein n=1 Tax=Egicoccus sp. AB-alg2 TaxID=3242693 RepID=UPI00359D574C